MQKTPLSAESAESINVSAPLRIVKGQAVFAVFFAAFGGLGRLEQERTEETEVGERVNVGFRVLNRE